MNNDQDNQDPPLKRRGDNVGQSGRWQREGADPGMERYGNEESFHSTDHPEGKPHEAPHREPNADKPNVSRYSGSFDSPEQGEERGDDKSRYGDASYADAGGELGGNPPKHPGKRWSEGGAGHGEDYGARGKGGNADGNGGT
jgi:hypothetical protein